MTDKDYCMSSYLASFMLKGSDAYTFRFSNGKFASDELKRAENFAEINGLNLHYVDISFDDVKKSLPKIMETKCAPVHSIEPQIYLAALQAKTDGVTKMVIGDAADYVFYGLDMTKFSGNQKWQLWCLERFLNENEGK